MSKAFDGMIREQIELFTKNFPTFEDNTANTEYAKILEDEAVKSKEWENTRNKVFTVDEDELVIGTKRGWYWSPLMTNRKPLTDKTKTVQDMERELRIREGAFMDQNWRNKSSRDKHRFC